MKVEFIGRTNDYFVKGMVYDASINRPYVEISLCDNEIHKISIPFFERHFKEHFPYTAICVADIKDVGFTVGKQYKYRIDDSEFPYILIRDDGVTANMPMKVFHDIFIVIDDSKLSSQKEEVESPKQYMIFVQGGQAPKRIHDCLVIAEQEAKRLALKPQNIGKTVYVMEVKKMFKSKVVLETM